METLFHFHWTHFDAALIALLPACLNFWVAFYVRRFLPHNKVSNVFTIFVITIALWQLSDVFMRISATKTTAEIWTHFFSLMTCATSSLGLHFALLFTQKKRLTSSSLFMAFVYLPLVVGNLTYSLGAVLGGKWKYHSFWGWQRIASESNMISILLSILMSSFGLIILLILVTYAYQVRSNQRKKIQALLIAIGFAIPVFVGVITQVIFPYILKLDPIPIASAVMSAFSITTLIALSKYQMFELSKVVTGDVVLDVSDEMIITVAPTRALLSINRQGSKILGIKESNVEGYSVEDLFLQKITKVHAFNQSVWEPVQSGRKVQNINIELHTQDGKEIPVLLTAVPISTGKKSEPCVLLSARDISEIRRYEKQIIQTREEAISANKAKSLFLANMSHELRTPLNAVIGYSEMLQEDAIDMGLDDFDDDLKKISKAGKHLLSLINDILDLSKIEAGKVELFPERFELNEFTQEVINTIMPMAERNRNQLKLTQESEIADIFTDQTRLRQVLLNLMSNACKFTEDGDVELVVRSETSEKEDFVVFEVKDTGIGMTPSQIKKLFLPFTQLDPSTTRKYDGTGLGLVISRRLCDLMGGELTVDSERGVGSTFRVRLLADPTSKVLVPRTIPDVTAAQNKIPTSGELLAVLGEGAQQKVLVVDDDASVRDLMQRMLTKEGYTPLLASTGEEGLEMARVYEPDAIVLDVLLPGLSGWDILILLKSDPKLADIPVIMSTVVDNKKKGYTLGASDFLVKPLQQDALTKVLDRFRSELDGDAPILVVEDEADIRDLLRRTLEKSGYEVNTAENGQIALEKVQECKPCLILLDLMMPEMDGFQVLEVLRSTEQWLDIPVIVITAMELTPKQRSMLQHNVATVYEKGSYEQKELHQNIRFLLKQTLSPP